MARANSISYTRGWHERLLDLEGRGTLEEKTVRCGHKGVLDERSDSVLLDFYGKKTWLNRCEIIRLEDEWVHVSVKFAREQML